MNVYTTENTAKDDSMIKTASIGMNRAINYKLITIIIIMAIIARWS